MDDGEEKPTVGGVLWAFVLKGVIMKQTVMLIGLILLVVAGCASLPFRRKPAREITVTLPGGATVKMVWIPQGTFMMGSPDTDDMALWYEKPQHEVTITRGFYLGKFEVTQAQWEAVMGTTPWEGLNVQEGPNNPAVWISWNDVQAFIDSLNATEGFGMYRLPTEAEWEYACRAGTTTQWSFGGDEEQLGDYAWYRDNARDVGESWAHEVGTKLPNPWGLYDMHGNVFEWVEDCPAPYPSEPQTDPIGPVSEGHIVRGGCFGVAAPGLRSAVRNVTAPPRNASARPRNVDIGARLVRQ